MPDYAIRDPRTGKQVRISAPRQPTESELLYIYAHPQNALPQTLTAPVKLNLDPRAQEAAVAPLATPPGALQEPRRAPLPPAPATPLQLFSGVTSAPAAAAMGSLADDPGDALKAIHEALETAWRAPITPTEEQTGMGKELRKRGVPMGEGMTAAVDIFSDPTNLIGGDMLGDVAKAAVIGGPSVAKGLGRLYTRLAEEVLPRFKAKAAHPSRILSDVKNFGSPMEAEWTGLSDWLTSKGNTPVVREEFDKYIKDNPLKIEETKLGFTKPEDLKDIPQRVVDTGYGNQWAIEHPWAQSGTGLTAHVSYFDPDNAARLFGREASAAQKKKPWVATFQNQEEFFTDKDEAIDWAKKAQMDVLKKGNIAATIDRPRWGRSDLNLPGGENYREIVMTLPFTKEQEAAIRAKGYSPTDQEAARLSGGFSHGSHWPGTPNPLTHLRLNDRVTADGKQALHIEELQSDWHQQGREKGYATTPDTSGWTARHSSGADDVNAAPTGSEEGWWNVYDAQGKRVGTSRSDLSYIRSPEDAIQAVASREKFQGVPDAPYKGTAWVELGLKRALIEAVESGADELTWTTGRQQGKRYNSMVEDIRSVRRHPTSGELELIEGDSRTGIALEDDHLKEIKRMLPPDEAERFQKWVNDTADGQPEKGFEVDVDAEEADAFWRLRDEAMTHGVIPANFSGDTNELLALLENFESTGADDSVGEALMKFNEARDASIAAMNYEAKRGKKPTRKGPRAFKFSAPLEIQSRGMVEQYDEKMVNIANKLGKKYDAQVTKSRVVTKSPPPTEIGKRWAKESPETDEVHSFPITEKLRKQILEKGLPLAAAAPMGMLPGQDDASPDKPEPLVTPRLESGESPVMTIGGRKGRFNFDVPPETGGTPAPRYAFDTEDGGRWFYQLEKRLQGGRWESAHHAEADFRRYKALDPATRTATMEAMWGNSPIAAVIDKAAADKVSFGELRRRLKPHNTHRQISDGEPKPK